MPEAQIKKIHDLAVVIADGLGALPAPSAPPDPSVIAGFDRWGNNFEPLGATISVDASGGSGQIQNGLLAAWDLVDGVWRNIVSLNGGAAVDLSAIGFEERLIAVSIFGPLQLHGVVTGGIAVTAKVTPLARKG